MKLQQKLHDKEKNNDDTHCKLANSFVWQVQLSLLHISLFKVIKRKYFSQGKCEFMKFLFVLLNKIKILTL